MELKVEHYIVEKRHYTADGKYFPETEADGHPFKLMTEESEQEQIRLIRAIQEGKIKLEPKK